MLMMAGRRVLPMVLLLWPAFAMAADEDLRNLVRELATEVHRLSGRVVELEKKLEAAEARSAAAQTPQARPAQGPPETAAANHGKGNGGNGTAPAPVTVGESKGTYRIPGTDTSLAFGGFVKLDAIYNSVSVGGDGGTNAADQILQPSQIPMRGAGEHSQVTFHPRSSRLWVKASTPTSWGALNAYLEMDFLALQSPGLERVTNSYAPGLRHAYGNLGPFLAGQTWTTFMNAAALPELNDFGAPVGRLFVRQPLMRWSEPLQLAGLDAVLHLALESPETALIDAARCTSASCAIRTPDDDRVPDMVARLDLNPAWGSVSVAGLARRLRIAEAHSQSEAWGGAVSLAGKIRGPGFDSLSLMASWGEGLGRYLYNAVFPDAALDPSGHLVTIESYGGYLAYQHVWNPNWRSTLVYGYAEARNPSYLPGTVTEWVSSGHANVLWSPLLRTTFGLEYAYARRGLENGRNGELHRLQFSAQYNF